MEKKIKIMFLIHALNPAGAQRVLVDTVNSLDKDRYDITVQTIHNTGELIKELRSDIRHKAIIASQDGFLARIQGFLIRRVLPPAWSYNFWIKDDYDVEVAFLEGECTKLISASTNKTSKKYAWVHVDFRILFDAAKCFRSIEQQRSAYDKFDEVVCVSNGVKDGFIEKIAKTDNVIVKYNVLDEEKVLRKAEERIGKLQRFSVDALCFVCVGNMRAQKGYERLLKVCKRLVKEGYRFSLSIIGSGSLLENIKQLVRELALQEYIHIMGGKSNPYGYIKQADALICSSYTEGYSTVAIEASILGIPTLTTDCSGMKEIFGESEYGMIVENSEEGLYWGIKNICDHPEQLKKYREKLKTQKEAFSKRSRVAEIEKLWLNI